MPYRTLSKILSILSCTARSARWHTPRASSYVKDTVVVIRKNFDVTRVPIDMSH